MKKIDEIINKVILEKDQFIIGYANLTNLLNEEYTNYNYAIVIGKKLDDDIVDNIIDGPTIEYYNHYNQINKDLSFIINNLSKELKSIDISNIIVEPTVNDRSLDDKYYKTLQLNFSHKMAATRAGLGWIGKTDLFISSVFGPRLRLATLLTNYPLKTDKLPINESKCGKCSLCLDKCPANAAIDKLWNINIHRNEFFNAFKCREKCRELTKININKDDSLCGMCVSICPIGRKNTYQNK